MKYRTKIMTVEAMQLTRHGKWEDWFREAMKKGIVIVYGSGKFGAGDCYAEIKSSRFTTKIAHEGDYIIKGKDGELAPCKYDIFEKLYEEDK